MKGKWLTTCCLLIAIALKAAMCYHFFQFETDKSYQAIAAMNLVEGNGLTIGKADVTDLTRIHFEPVIGWPPGYSLFIAFFYGISGDLKGASLLSDVLGTVLFMLGLYWLL